MTGLKGKTFSGQKGGTSFYLNCSTEQRKERRIEGRKEVGKERWMDGRKEVRKEGRMEGRKKERKAGIISDLWVLEETCVLGGNIASV